MTSEKSLLTLIESAKKRFEEPTLAVKQKVYSLIDLTSLNDSDDAKKIDTLCRKAQSDLGQVAAVCVYPQYVKQVTCLLAGSAVKIATVLNFPHGTDPLETVVGEINTVIENGANEIDVVFPYTLYLGGEKTKACDFVSACKRVGGKFIILKVILETGAINNSVILSEMSREVLAAGADFIKTSTGKIPQGVSLEAAAIMLLALKKAPGMSSHGFKAAGGIRHFEQALQYIALAEHIFSPDWVLPSHFRLGASQLVDTLLGV